MNKDIVRQITNVVALLATITVNALANILPINGQNTGQISDSFKVFFVPAGYVFSIWSLINGKLPANAGFENPDPEIPAAPVTEVTAVDGRIALSESLAFGGNNVHAACCRSRRFPSVVLRNFSRRRASLSKR